MYWKSMDIRTSNINSLWGHLIIEELYRNGVTGLFISPGSRSTPLTVAAACHPAIDPMVCVDELAAAFQALGHARATGQPAALICTSGTALANYLPAVIEAFQDRVPLMVLSADRPPELRDTGANQTIDQVKLYGGYAKFCFDLPCPDEALAPQVVLTTLDQLVHQAVSAPAGPVHLNCMFREPLAPTPCPIDPGYTDRLTFWQNRKTPYSRFSPGRQTADETVLAKLAERLKASRRGILAVGRLSSPAETHAAARLAETLNWPVFADVLSGLRLSLQTKHRIAYFDQLLLSKQTAAAMKPETMLHIGGPFTSKRFLEFLQHHRPEHYIGVQPHCRREDPAHRRTWVIQADIHPFCQALCPRLATHPDTRWVHWIKRCDAAVAAIIDRQIAAEDGITDISLAREISRQLPENTGLFLGNSMPVRDMDMYGDAAPSPIRVAGNRGASGIDGTLATAVGFARGLNQPVTAVLGDMALLHDLSSFSLIERLPQAFVLIAINNHGGGIFSFLPVADFPQICEPFFSTAHRLEFSGIAAMFHLPYHRIETNAALVRRYRQAVSGKGPVMIEITTDRGQNVALHRHLQQTIASALDLLPP
jgi:2-succinyl-5-enolpyruvyl-6-hydroxy-3-cyclohexene-1-carboxylate synthase